MTSEYDWSAVLIAGKRTKGVSDTILKKVQSSIGSALSRNEITSVNKSQINPFPRSDPLYKLYKRFDASAWQLPNKPLPSSYVAFLKWANGGTFRNGDRSFAPLFPCQELRDYLIAHHVPEYMPGALPIGLDGDGNFYVIDMRKDPVKGEYPIRFVSGGALGFAKSVVVGKSFWEACFKSSDPKKQLYSLFAKKK